MKFRKDNVQAARDRVRRELAVQTAIQHGNRGKLGATGRAARGARRKKLPRQIPPVRIKADYAKQLRTLVGGNLRQAYAPFLRELPGLLASAAAERKDSAAPVRTGLIVHGRFASDLTRADYSEDQPRDEHGRFGEGSGGASTPKAGREAEDHLRAHAASLRTQAEHAKANGDHEGAAVHEAAAKAADEQRMVLYKARARKEISEAANAALAKDPAYQAQLAAKSQAEAHAAAKIAEHGPHGAALDALATVKSNDEEGMANARAHFEHAIGQGLASRASIERNNDMGVELMDDQGTVGFHQPNGYIGLSREVFADATAFARAYTADPAGIKDSIATMRDRFIAGESPTPKDRMIAKRIVGVHVIAHEVMHGYGPLDPDDYHGHGAVIEEVATEVATRVHMEHVYGYDARAMHGTFSLGTEDEQIAEPPPYHKHVERTAQAIADHYQIDRESAYQLLKAASTDFKRQPVGTTVTLARHNSSQPVRILAQSLAKQRDTDVRELTNTLEDSWRQRDKFTLDTANARDVWELDRNDLEGAWALYQRGGMTADDLSVLIQLQDDPAELLARIRGTRNDYDENQPRDEHGRFGEGGGGGKAAPTANVPRTAKAAASAIAEHVHATSKDKPGYPGRDKVEKNWAKQINVKGIPESSFNEIDKAIADNNANPAFNAMKETHGIPDTVVHTMHAPGRPQAERQGSTTILYHHPDLGASSMNKAEPPRPGVATTQEWGGTAAVLRHEYGHSVYDAIHKDPAKGEKWREIKHDNPKAISTYSALKDDELFSESFAVVTDRQYDPHQWAAPERAYLTKFRSLIGLKGERNDTVRKDAGESARARQLLAEARARMQDAVRPARVEELAKLFAERTATYQRIQLQNQVRAALGADVFISDRKLATRVQGFVHENVALVEKIPVRLHSDLETMVQRALNAGQLHEDLAADIEQRFGISERHAELVARDQVGKIYSDVNRQRQQDLGVTRFIWRTVNDERVRGIDPKDSQDHISLDGETFSYDDPPDTGDGPALPGEDINCRCYAEGVYSDLLGDDSESDKPEQDDDQEPDAPTEDDQED